MHTLNDLTIQHSESQKNTGFIIYRILDIQHAIPSLSCAARSHEQQTIHRTGKRARETALLPVLATREADEQRDVQHIANTDAVDWDHFEDMALWGKLGLNGDVFSPIGTVQLTR